MGKETSEDDENGQSGGGCPGKTKSSKDLQGGNRSNNIPGQKAT